MTQPDAALQEAANAALIRFVERFTTLSLAERQVLQSTVTLRRYGRNQMLTDPRELAASGFFVVEGCVCSYTDFTDQQTIGDFFVEGEPVLLAPEDPANQYTRCLRFLEDTVVAVADAQETERIVRAFPAFALVCRRFAEERLGWQIKLGSHLKTLRPLERWAFLQRERPALIGRVPQHLLATFLGMTPETLSRTLTAANR